MQRINVLLIEDNPGDVRLLRELLGGAGGPGITLECAGRLSAGLAALENTSFDAVILDLSLPDSRGLETFDRLHAAAGRVPVVVLTGLDDEELALSAVARGAQDYVVKGSVNAASLLRILRFAVERAKAAGQTLGQSGAPAKGKLIGVVGARGGSGATTVTLNLAAALAGRGKSAAALEIAPYRAGFRLQTQMTPRRDLADLLSLDAETPIPPAEFRKHLVAGDWGAHLLFAAGEPERYCELDPARIEALVETSAAVFDFTLLDLPGAASAVHRAACRLCDPLLITTERSPAGVAAGRDLVSLFSVWGVDKKSMAAVLVTKDPMSAFVPAPQAAAEIGVPVVSVIPPAAEALEICRRKGSPLVVAEPESLAADSLRALAERLAAPVLTAVEV
jgi:DNA-binding response OmpR family regulator